MNYEHITSDDQLVEFCHRIRDVQQLGFDTEFVSEHTFQPQLCLIQVTAADELALIDPMVVKNTKPFWELLTKPGLETIVHAGREELLFCLRTIGKSPWQIFDLQIAAGLVGLEYPAAYGNLISRLLHKTLPKGETRTDWRRRPLTDSQLEYALQDVIYLQQLRDSLHDQLSAANRLSWLTAEMGRWQEGVNAYEKGENWRRVSGISGLSARSLAVVREVWRWRKKEAQRRDTLPKRVLRDDLIVELSRRQMANPKKIQAVRGMQRRDLERQIPQLAQAIHRAVSLPESELPSRGTRSNHKQLTTIGQFMHTALNSICRTAKVSPSLVGTAQDVRDLIAYYLQLNDSPQDAPTLAQGWRAEVVGKQLEELMAGRLTIRVRDPLAGDPLVFETTPGQQ